MLPDIIKTEYEVEILSDNSNVYTPGDFYPFSDFLDDFLVQYESEDVESIIVRGLEPLKAIAYICQIWEIDALIHTYKTIKTTQSVKDL